ncbi:MAG: HigA family addiction module antidote protein [Lachnospiraceae bacterium]|nr:HigA family addiction module antidote protein [Lachnospiraceae bacterium]
MSNYIEYKDKVAFHPGYYIKEIIDESGLTQEDFAKRLDTTPKNLSLLIRGEQSLSIDIAMKLSRLLGTSVKYWLNLQNSYDCLIAEFKSDKELEEERQVFKKLDYKYFRINYDFPALPRQVDEQICRLRAYLNVSTLSVLKKRDMTASFRGEKDDINEASTIKANTMVQIAMNEALKVEAPRFNKKKFEASIEYALTLTRNYDDLYSKISKAFLEAGVIFIILSNISGSRTTGATKKIGNNIMLMVNDQKLCTDTFWFALFNEIGHIIYGDFGISFDNNSGKVEESANKFAENKLIPDELYYSFVKEQNFNVASIKKFANEINRDPGIVLGRLEIDEIVDYSDVRMKSLRHKYNFAGI